MALVVGPARRTSPTTMVVTAANTHSQYWQQGPSNEVATASSSFSNNSPPPAARSPVGGGGSRYLTGGDSGQQRPGGGCLLLVGSDEQQEEQFFITDHRTNTCTTPSSMETQITRLDLSQSGRGGFIPLGTAGGAAKTTRLPRIHRGTVSLSFNPKVDTYDIPPPDDDQENTAIPDLSGFDAGALSPGRSRATPRRGNVKAGATATPHNTPKSASPVPVEKKPEWFENLTDWQINKFKEVFDMLEKDGGVKANSTELYNALKEIDDSIKKEEINAVIAQLDKDGNGDIDFDEFLYAMCMTDRVPKMFGTDEKDKPMYTKRQRVFLTAIMRFTIKNSLGEIERFYANKARRAPHVISFYTAGARLTGLSDRQLEQELRRLQKASKNQDSPYAKVPFMTTRPTKSAKRRATGKGRSPRATSTTSGGTARGANVSGISEQTIQTVSSSAAPESELTLSINTEADDTLHEEEDNNNWTADEEAALVGMLQSNATRGKRENHMVFDTKEITDVLKELADSGSVVARLPDVHLVSAIRTKLEVGDKQMLCSSLRKRRQHNAHTSLGSRSARTRASYGSSRTPRPNSGRVPKIDMPSIPMGDKRQTLTVQDVPFIRQKVSKALGLYYRKVQKTHVKAASNQWNNLNNTVKSGQLKEKFHKIYMTYSPQEDDVFMTASWIPGPRYASACAGTPVTPFTPLPTPRPHSTGPPVVRSTSYGRTSRMSTTSARPSTSLK